MSKDDDFFLGRGNKKERVLSEEVGESLENTYAALSEKIKWTKQVILLEKQRIAENKKYILQRDLSYLENFNLLLFQRLEKSSSADTLFQQKIAERIQFNLNLMAEISQAPGGILPDVKDAKEATLHLERNLENLEQNLEDLEQELLILEQELVSKKVNMAWEFFGGNSNTEEPDDSDEELDQAFQTLNRRRLKG